MNKITILSGGRFISEHAAAAVYYDSRHKVIKCRCVDGVTLELVREYVNGEPRDQFLTVRYSSGRVAVMDCLNGRIP